MRVTILHSSAVLTFLFPRFCSLHLVAFPLPGSPHLAPCASTPIAVALALPSSPFVRMHPRPLQLTPCVSTWMSHTPALSAPPRSARQILLHELHFTASPLFCAPVWHPYPADILKKRARSRHVFLELIESLNQTSPPSVSYQVRLLDLHLPRPYATHQVPSINVRRVHQRSASR